MVTLIIVLLFIRLLGSSLMFIIWTYLKSKLPAMQTLKDAMIIQLMVSTAIVGLTSDCQYLLGNTVNILRNSLRMPFSH